MPQLDDLPEEVASAIAEHEEKSADRLIAHGTALTILRDAAVKARKESGSEDVW